MNKKPVYIGMDFGTFKTSVACSNGRREVLYTAVGWPKDYVARSVLGCDVVFGEDVVQQRLSLDVVRPFAKGILKYRDLDETEIPLEDVEKHKEAASLLVSHAVSLMQPPPHVPVFGVIGSPSRASKTNKKVIMEAANSAFDAVLIVPEPFTVAYGMNRLTDTLVIDIGAGTTDLCPMCGRYPTDEDQVTVPMGGDMIDEKFKELLAEKYPDVQVSEKMTRDIKEKYGFVHDVNERAVVKLPVGGQRKEVDVTEPLKEACRTIVPPIIKAIQEIIARFDPEFQQPLLDNILLGGGGSQLNGLDHLIEESLEQFGGGNVTKVYDSVFAGAVGALKLAMGTPEDYWEKLRSLDSSLAFA